MGYELEEYIFDCPFCNRRKLTFISKEKNDYLKRHPNTAALIFDLHYFKPVYREIFISKFCSTCCNEENGYDMDVYSKAYAEQDKNYTEDFNLEKSKLYEKIEAMYEAEERK